MKKITQKPIRIAAHRRPLPSGHRWDCAIWIIIRWRCASRHFRIKLYKSPIKRSLILINSRSIWQFSSNCTHHRKNSFLHSGKVCVCVCWVHCAVINAYWIYTLLYRYLNGMKNGMWQSKSITHNSATVNNGNRLRPFPFPPAEFFFSYLCFSCINSILYVYISLTGVQVSFSRGLYATTHHK